MPVSHAVRSAKQSRRWKGCCTATFVYSNRQLYRRADRIRMLFSALHESAHGRFCCKSLFALAIKNSFGRRRDFHVKMWGTSSPEDKLAGDLGNVIEATSVVGRIFLQQKIWRRAFWDFCNNIGTKRRFAAVRKFGCDRSEADMP